MKKYHYLLFPLLVLSSLILASCSNAAGEGQASGGEVGNPEVVSGESVAQVEETEPPLTEDISEVEAEVTETPPVPPTEDAAPQGPAEIPAIPEVNFGPGDAWFRPTRPSDIQLASGGVQLFEFSAVW
jgi:predicted small secreted protein